MSNQSFLILMVLAIAAPLIYFNLAEQESGTVDGTANGMLANPSNQFGLTSFAPANPGQSGGLLPANSIVAATLPGDLPGSAGRLTPANGLPPVLIPANATMSGSTRFFGNQYGPDFSAPMEFMPIGDFREVFRFDVNPEWVKNRWERISTTPGDSGVQGLRVPLVTGTNTWDLHGSLTYFFDANHKLQRIQFRGWTGDATHLLNLLAGQFGFEQQKTLWAGLYLAGTTRKPTGGIILQHPNVIRSHHGAEKVALMLEINHPEGGLGLSNQFQAMMAPARQVK